MRPPFDLSERVALVTGATGALGRAIADALAQAGARLVITARHEPELHALATSLGDSVLDVVAADLGREPELESLFATFDQQGRPLDILVNNAGVASDVPFGSVRAEDFERVLSLNVTATFLCTQSAAPIMRGRGGGKVINIGSIYGTVAADPGIYEGADDMVRCSTAYAASKAALINMTRDLAVRLGPENIQVNLVSPGGIEGDQPESFKRNYRARTPAGRMATPADIAPTVAFLASSASDYVSGQNLHVDGGFTAW